jgi:hypothetical protein
MTAIFRRPISIRAVVAAASFLLVASCGSPGIKVDQRGLGDSQIGQLLTRTWMNSPEWISGQVADMLKGTDGSAPTVAHAQAIGFQCGATLSTCKYSGQLNYRLLNLPAENAAREKGMATFNIEITSENPLVIQTNKNSTE